MSVVHTHTSHTGYRSWLLDDGTAVVAWANGYGLYYIAVQQGRALLRTEWTEQNATLAWWHARRRRVDPAVVAIIETALPFLKDPDLPAMLDAVGAGGRP